jgi:hypothetical protein
MNLRADASPVLFAIRYVSFAFLLFGCSGRGTMQFVSLNMADIDPPPTKVWKFDAQESSWWIDDDGELNLTLMHRQRSLILGKLGHVDLGLSLVFNEPPAGRARNYKIAQREGRVLYRSALANQRFVPFTGIVSVIFSDGGVVRGSFRLWMAPVAEVSFLSFLPHRPGNLLCFGTFEAVHDARRGKRVRQFCESGGHTRTARSKPATTRPAK